MNQSPAWNDKAIDFFNAHPMMGKRFNRSERKTFIHQTGKITVRTQRSDSELNLDAAIKHRWFPLGANFGSLSHEYPLATCHDYIGILLKPQIRSTCSCAHRRDDTRWSLDRDLSQGSGSTANAIWQSCFTVRSTSSPVV
jgi:hypothetical protein